jgi:hypothetical protein
MRALCDAIASFDPPRYAVGVEDDEEGDGLGALLDLSSIEPFLSPPPQSFRRTDRTGSTNKLASNNSDRGGGGWGKNNNNISASGGSGGDGGWDSVRKGERVSVRGGSDAATVSKGGCGGSEEQAFNAWQQQVSTHII